MDVTEALALLRKGVQPLLKTRGTGWMQIASIASDLMNDILAGMNYRILPKPLDAVSETVFSSYLQGVQGTINFLVLIVPESLRLREVNSSSIVTAQYLAPRPLLLKAPNLGY